MYLAEVLVGNMGVNLGGGYRGVAEHDLDAANVCSVQEQVGGKGVAQGMGRNILDDAGLQGMALDEPVDRAWS